MSHSYTRRRLLGSALTIGAVAASGQARAAGRTLNVLAHRVHQLSLTTGVAGDQTEAWRTANDCDLAWATFDTDPLQDRLFREASLEKTDFGVGFLVNSRATQRSANLLQPLDALRAEAPIEAWDDIAPGLVQGMTIDGKLVGVPFRHATIGLFYNEALMEARGISAPPTSLEELLDQAKRLTFRTEEGRPVTGMVLASELSVFPVTFARAFGGDFIGPDLKLVPDPAALEHGIAAMASLFAAGALPRSYATTTNDDQVTAMQQGRACFTVLPFARYAQLNNKDQSRFPGRIKAIEFPLSETLKGKAKMAAVTEFWAMSIPRNFPDPKLAWSFIRAMSSKSVCLGAARNGNGPVRLSTYDEPSFTASQPQAAVERQALQNARVPLPAFPEAARAQAIFVEEVQLAVLGRKSPQEAVAAITTRVQPLLAA